jgi:hypothetical protein
MSVGIIFLYTLGSTPLCLGVVHCECKNHSPKKLIPGVLVFPPLLCTLLKENEKEKEREKKKEKEVIPNTME